MLVAKAIDVDAAMFEHMVIRQMQEESKKKVSCSRDKTAPSFTVSPRVIETLRLALGSSCPVILW